MKAILASLAIAVAATIPAAAQDLSMPLGRQFVDQGARSTFKGTIINAAGPRVTPGP